MPFQRFLCVFAFGLGRSLLSEKHLFGHLQSVFVEALFYQHFGPSPPNSQTVFSHFEGHLDGLVQDLVAPPQLALVLQ